MRLKYLLFFLVFFGCVKDKDKAINADLPDFSKFYDVKESVDNRYEFETFISLKNITIDARAMPFSSFIAYVANTADISIIADQSLNNLPVTLSVNDIPAEKVLDMLARQLNVFLRRDGKLFFIGATRSEDNSVYVTKCLRLSKQDIVEAVSALKTVTGRVVAYDDGLVVVSDTPDILLKVDNMIQSIKRATADTWIVQYIFLLYRESDLKDLSFNIGSNFSLSSAVAGDKFSSADVSALINKILTTGKARLLAQPLILLEDGSSGSVIDGEQVPIPRKTVSDAGTVTVTGVDYKDTGLSVHLTIKDMGDNSVRLRSLIELNSINGYVGDYPRVKGQKVEFSTALSTNQSYLVASLSQNYNETLKGNETTAGINAGANTDKNFVNGLFNFGKTNKREDTNNLMQIWVRAYRISSMVKVPDISEVVTSVPVIDDILPIVEVVSEVVPVNKIEMPEIEPLLVIETKKDDVKIDLPKEVELTSSRVAPFVHKRNPAVVLPTVEIKSTVASPKKIISQSDQSLNNSRRPATLKVSTPNHVPVYNSTPIELPAE